jgi:thymidylate synthase
MITINEESVDSALKKAISRILDIQENSQDPELFAETQMTIDISNPEDFAVDWRSSPEQLMGLLAHVECGDKIAIALVDHYGERLKSGKLDAVHELIKKNKYTKRAVLSVWDSSNDLVNRKGSACVNYYWFRVKGNKIDCHSHMRACDVFSKLAANLGISCDLHVKFANSLSLSVGSFSLFIDCAHIYKKDYHLAKKLIQE